MTSARKKVDDALAVVADPIRRRVLDSLKVIDGGRRAGDLAKMFPDISRPAVSKHLRILREKGFIQEEWRGRECWYRVNPQALKDIHDWASQYEALWKGRLGRLKNLVEEDL
jgi:DNA-binding transcriptional ArsR family regulator